MRTQTLVFIIVSGILLLLWGVFALINSITKDIQDTNLIIDSALDRTKALERTMKDSFPRTNNSTVFAFDTAGVKSNSYTLSSGDDSTNVIFLNPQGEKVHETKIKIAPQQVNR